MNLLPIRMKFALTREDAVLPTYAHKGDAGMDLVTPETVVLRPGVPTFVDTGVAMELPRGYVGDVRSRSSFAKRGITASNGLGTIDSTYRGSIGVVMLWMLSIDTLLESFNDLRLYSSEAVRSKQLEELLLTLSRKNVVLEKGSKIAQLVVHQVTEVDPALVTHSELTATDRGQGGFGSTGR